MRNALVLLTAFCVSGTLIGCNSQSTPTTHPQPAPKAEKQGRLGWTLKLQSKCAEEIDASECLAGYGFSILTNGEFQVGPGPQGETRPSGTLTEDEINSVNAALGSTLTASAARSEGHEAIEASESEDTLSLTRGTDNPEVLVRTAGVDLFFQTQSAEEAKSLLSLVRSLATKYYATPFP